MGRSVKKQRIEVKKRDFEQWRISLREAFSRVPDPRDVRGKRYRLDDILILATYGTLWGFTDFANMCVELEYHLPYFRKLLSLERIPSHDCFSATFAAIDPEHFITCFMEWLAQITSSRGKHVAIDGKAVRAACEKAHSKYVPYILNAFLVEEGVLFSQMRIDAKKNEISTIPEFLEWLDLNDSIVTIDAIGAQYEIADKIVSKGGVYVLPVKLNQPSLQQDIKEYLENYGNPKFDDISYLETFDKDHGRMETRKGYYSEDVSCLQSHEKWGTVKAIGMLERERIVLKDVTDKKTGEIVNADEVSQELVCYIMSAPIGAEQFMQIARSHWTAEKVRGTHLEFGPSWLDNQ
ncbi:MAG: ISAs1 family transposase [Spirochaetia bacterium]|nr:ISAs1 family transposase [Spirochaetia bacterium]